MWLPAAVVASSHAVDGQREGCGLRTRLSAAAEMRTLSKVSQLSQSVSQG